MISSEDKLNISFIIGIVGATGAVGVEIIKCLHQKKFPVKSLKLFASEKSIGKTLSTDYGDLFLEAFSVEECRKCHFVFLAVSSSFALEFATKITENNGPVVIDNSSGFRYNPEMPLVVSSIFIISIYSSL
jgi:aspartate-semialdehyde dehydrogenase